MPNISSTWHLCRKALVCWTIYSNSKVIIRDFFFKESHLACKTAISIQASKFWLPHTILASHTQHADFGRIWLPTRIIVRKPQIELEEPEWEPIISLGNNADLLRHMMHSKRPIFNGFHLQASNGNSFYQGFRYNLWQDKINEKGKGAVWPTKQ